MIDGVPARYKMKNDSKERTVISKNIKFEKEIGMRINKVIKDFNANSNVVKLNNDLFMNIAVDEYIKYLESLEDCFNELKSKALNFEG